MRREAARTADRGGAAHGVTVGVADGPRGRVVAALGFAVLTAIGARLSVPLPGLAVPMTLQPVAVLLAGLLLGSRVGASSQALYLAAGVAGLPVFAAGGGAAYLLGPTGGYLLAFPAAAAVAGLAARGKPSLLASAGWLIAGLALIHAGGLAWLWITGGPELLEAVGVRPFLLGDILKVALVLALAEGLQASSRRRRS
jgi:biotin transport system substrate-specific component